jgi:hypothetical protein
LPIEPTKLLLELAYSAFGRGCFNSSGMSGRSLLESFEAKDMLGYRHSGFSVDTSVRIEAHDRAALERL